MTLTVLVKVLTSVTAIYLPSATKLRRLCFYTCLSVHGGGVLSACWDATHPPPPSTRHPPAPDPPWDLAPPGTSRHTPLPGTSRQPPVPAPPPLPSRPRTVRILLECIFVSKYCHRSVFFFYVGTRESIFARPKI